MDDNITIRNLKAEMIQVQKLCRRGIHDLEPVDPAAVTPLLKIRGNLLLFLRNTQNTADEIEALRLVYYAECYLLNFRKAGEYLEKVCALSGDRRDRQNLVGLNELVSRMKTLPLAPEKLFELKNHLAAQLAERPCDHTLKFTKLWLGENEEKKNHAKIIRGLQNSGGYCDCEVLANV
jgi:hypothetical protein